VERREHDKRLSGFLRPHRQAARIAVDFYRIRAEQLDSFLALAEAQLFERIDLRLQKPSARFFGADIPVPEGVLGWMTTLAPTVGTIRFDRHRGTRR
jgi:hypothetical protein